MGSAIRSSFFQIFADDFFEVTAYLCFAIASWLICFSNLDFQGNRLLVSLFYSLGGDLSLHIFVTSFTSIVLGWRLNKGIKLDSFCNYLAIVARPKSEFSLTKGSRLITIISLILMNHLAEQAVNYGVPSVPSLKAVGLKQRSEVILAPLGGGVLTSADRIDCDSEDRKAKFRFFATGLSILATGPNENNTEFYTQNENVLQVYHLPQDLFSLEKENMIAKDIKTIGYVGEIRREERIKIFDRCATTSSNDLESSCKGALPPKGVRYSFEVKNIPATSRRMDLQYSVSLVNADDISFGNNWTYTIDFSRKILNMDCDKRVGDIICTNIKDTNEFIDGIDWIDTEKHAKDLSLTMASCFVNLLSFETRAKRIDTLQLVGKLLTAMLVRHASDNSKTGGLSTCELGDRNVDWALGDALITFRGPQWLQALILGLSILALLSLFAKLFFSSYVPSAIISIISSLGSVVSETRAACISERSRALSGLVEIYRDKEVI